MNKGLWYSRSSTTNGAAIAARVGAGIVLGVLAKKPKTSLTTQATVEVKAGKLLL
jgi:hypothetical protein